MHSQNKNRKINTIANGADNSHTMQSNVLSISTPIKIEWNSHGNFTNRITDNGFCEIEHTHTPNIKKKWIAN